MQPSLEWLEGLLESPSGRDKVIRTICHSSQLVGVVLSQRTPGSQSSQLGKSLLLSSAQLSHYRTVLRLFDDLSVLAHSRSYVRPRTKEEDRGLHWISVLKNAAVRLMYPCEHIAWAADAELIKAKSDKWRLFSTVLSGTSLLLGILRSVRLLTLLKKRLESRDRKIDRNSTSSHSELPRRMRQELLSIISSMADLSNAIHRMPPGFLWAGRFPNWLVGLMGTLSSLIGLVQFNTSNNDQ